MKFIVFSDIHFYKNPNKSKILSDGSYSWLNEQFKVVDQIFDFAEKNDVEIVIHNGDLFEEKNRIDVAVYNLTWEYFFHRKDKFELIFNVGNHDIYKDIKNSSLQPFSELAKIIDEPWDYWIGTDVLRFLPYGSIEGYLETPQTDGKKFLFIHENIAGLKIGPTDYVAGSQYKPHIFTGWVVFNGHIHKQQELNNIYNIGSPMVQDFGEAGESKRFMYYDGEIVHSINIDCPQFHILNSLDELKDINDRDYYRIDIDSSQLDDEVFQRWNVYPNIVQTFRESGVRLSKVNSLEDEIIKYVEISDSILDKEKLIEIGKQFIGENK